MYNNVVLSQRLLYYTYGILTIIVGIDKFFDYITHWSMYYNPAISEFLHVSPEVFMYIVGIIEIVAGLLVLWRPIIGGYVVASWLVIIAINLFTIRYEYAGFVVTYYDIAFRDIAMAVGACVLSLLSQHLEERHEREKHLKQEMYT